VSGLTEVVPVLSTLPQIHDGDRCRNDQHQTSDDARYDVHEWSLIVGADTWRIISTHCRQFAASSTRTVTVT